MATAQLRFNEYEGHVVARDAEGRSARGRTVDEATANFIALHSGKPAPEHAGNTNMIEGSKRLVAEKMGDAETVEREAPISAEQEGVDIVVVPDSQGGDNHRISVRETFEKPVQPMITAPMPQDLGNGDDPKRYATQFVESSRGRRVHQPITVHPDGLTQGEKQIVQMLSDIAQRVDRLEEERHASINTDHVTGAPLGPCADPMGDPLAQAANAAVRQDEIDILRAELATLRDSLASDWRKFVAKPSFAEMMLMGVVPLLRTMIASPSAETAEALKGWLTSLDEDGVSEDLKAVQGILIGMRAMLQPESLVIFDRVFGGVYHV